MVEYTTRRSKSLCLSLNLQVSDTSSGELSDGEYDDNWERRSLKGKYADPRRWWVLFIYGSAAITQVVIWNTWSPIANSALFAFPNWTPSTIALLNNWGCITFLVCIVPCCWFLNTKGLRSSFLLAAVMSTIGSGIRLIPIDEAYYTILVHVGAIFNALGGVSLSPAILLLSSTWFPPHERTTATGIGTTMSMLGTAASYVLGPTIVDEVSGEENINQSIYTMRTNTRSQIMLLCLIGFLAEVVLFFLILFFFPERPSQPPSRSSILKTVQPVESIGSSLEELMRKSNFWVLAISASLCSGVTGPWLSLLTIIFGNTGITQTETASLGFWTIICSCCLSLSVSKVSDYCPRRIRYILIGLILAADIMFVWILLITTRRIAFVKEKLALTVIGGLSLVWATPPLFYEFGAEITYPIPEGIVGGFMMALNNAVACCIYIQLYIFPNIDVTWMNYALVIFGFGSLLLLFFVRDEFNRLDVDKS